MFPYAITNPIYIDVDGNGRYDAPLPLPEWCSRRCDPTNPDPAQCPEGQVCLEDEGVCGYAIIDHCIRRPAASHGH